MRNIWLRSSLALVGALTVAAGPVQESAAGRHENPALQRGVERIASGPQRPNIVLIIADDLDLPSFELMLGSGLMPQTAKKLAQQGITFSNAFVTTAICCPSRASILTGQLSHNNGVFDNSRQGLGGVRRLRDGSTIATWLSAAGYRNGYVGKYLNEYGMTVPPTYVPPGWHDWQALVDPYTYNVYGYKLNDNGVVVTYGFDASDYQTDVLRQRANDFIDEAEADDDQPFFLLIAPLAPHQERTITSPGCEDSGWGSTIRPAPRHAGTLPSYFTLPKPPSFNEPDIRDKPSWFASTPALSALDSACAAQLYRARLESLLAVDDLIGGVINNLADKGELDSTVIVFTSDNGQMLGRHRLGGKTFAYEEAIRVPLIVRAPGSVRSVEAEIVLNVDFGPTFAELAGATPTITVDGRSFVPLLQKGDRPPWRRRFLVEYLTAYPQPLIPVFSALRNLRGDARTSNNLFVSWKQSGEKELYHQGSDPYQLQSQHANPATRAEQDELQDVLSRLMTSKGAAYRDLEDEIW